MYQNKIKHLEEAHRVLDKQIDSMERTGIYDECERTAGDYRLFLTWPDGFHQPASGCRNHSTACQ